MMAAGIHVQATSVPQAKAQETPWWILIEETPRWIRAEAGGEWLVNSKHALVVNEANKLPVYYFPTGDVNEGLLRPNGKHFYTPHKGTADLKDLVIGDKVVEDAAWEYPDPEEESAGLKGYLTFVWKAVDHWYEESEEIFVHPRDPYTRVDAIPSTRHVQVIINGETVADSTRPVILYETALTPRYYLPAEDIRFDLLRESSKKSRCPYKGVATYHDAVVGGKVYPDVVWSYQDPVPELPKIKGLYSFYNENVDELLVDGEPWSLGSNERLPYGKTPTDLRTGENTIDCEC